MKKLFILSLLVIFALSFTSFADAATKARTASVATGLQGVYGVGDLSSGNTAEVTDGGALVVSNRAVAVTSQLGDALVYTGACRVLGIQITGVSAADTVAVYDALTATGTAKFDPRTDTNNGSFFVDAKGAPFATGIYVDATDNDVFSSVTYDY